MRDKIKAKKEDFIMKKILSIVLTLMLACVMFVACEDKPQPPDDPTPSSKPEYTVYMPDGAPALSLVSQFDKTTIAGHKVNFNVVPSSSIASYCMSEQADLAILPTNAAANIYNKGKSYKYVAATSHGNLFGVGKNAISSVEELKGKVVGIIGEGQVPDMMMRAIFAAANIETVRGEAGAKGTEGVVTVVYAADGPTLMPLIKKGTVDFGVLGEPAVTTAINNKIGVLAFDVQALYGSENGYPQAGLVAKNTVTDQFLTEFLAAVKAGEKFAEENPEQAVSRIGEKMLEGTQSSIKQLSAETVQRCNIKIVLSKECKQQVLDLLTKIHGVKAEAVGGKVPDEAFFR